MTDEIEPLAAARREQQIVDRQRLDVLDTQVGRRAAGGRRSLMGCLG
jgi:hypothetical protein